MGSEQNEEWLPEVSKCSSALSQTILNPVGCRFFVDNTISNLADAIIKKYGDPTEQAFLFPSRDIAARCVRFFEQQVPVLDTEKHVRIFELFPRSSPVVNAGKEIGAIVIPTIAAVVFPGCYSNVAMTFWQHTGDGVSSRRAELCHKAFEDGYLAAKDGTDVHMEKFSTSHHQLRKGPRRYQKENLSTNPQNNSVVSENGNAIPANPKGLDGKEHVQFLEERYGRNLDVSLASNAKLAIRRRIAGALTADVGLHEALEVPEMPLRRRQVQGFSEEDVFLWPSGMSSIFNTHRLMMACRGSMKSISYG